MAGLDSWSCAAERLMVGVETSPGSGEFRVDECLRAEEVWQRSDRALSTARISVRLDDDLDSEEARRRYHPDLRLVVLTAESDPAGRRVLFEGYAPVRTARWDGRVGREEERFEFQAEHVLERAAAGRGSWVYGQRVRNGWIEDGLAADAEAFAGQSVLVTALPCVFNPDGEPNRAPQPLTVCTAAGERQAVPVFASTSHGAQRWTFGAVLRYLAWFYLPKAGPVYAGNVFAVTEGLVTGPADSLAGKLNREPVSLACEGMNLAEALWAWSRAAGVHVTAETRLAAGRVRTELRVWTAGCGRRRHLSLVRGGCWPDGTPRYDARGRSASEILSENHTHRGVVTWDYRQAAPEVLVLGDVRRYEMTVELRPGWLPRSHLDNVASGGRAAAKALALTPEQVEAAGATAEDAPWFRMYHRRGSEFKHATEVARLWVLNEDGYFAGTRYNRNPPFDDYQPFDFSSVVEACITTRGAWVRRLRRLRPCLTRSPQGRSPGVWVEVSFDGGATWQQQSGGVRVLDDRAGVYFDCENPTEIVPAGAEPAEQNLWYAIIDQIFRVRVTAVIEGDERLVGRSQVQEGTGAAAGAGVRVVRRPESFQFMSRSGTSNVLGGVGEPAERDDSQAIAAYARHLARDGQGGQVRALPAIPWIETTYELGDQISEIRGRHLRLAIPAEEQSRGPVVVARRFILREERYETELVVEEE